MSSQPQYGTLTYSLLGLVMLGGLIFLLSQPTDFAKWLGKKKYQYELTSGLYMCTPTEKFIFNSIVFMLASMTLIAGFLYLPAHLVIVVERALYYAGGDTSIWQTASSFAQEALNRVGNFTGVEVHEL